MGPRDSRDSSEANGNPYPVGKGKAKAKVSKPSPNPSIGDLTPEAIDMGLDAVRRVSQILWFMQIFGGDISTAEDVYGLYIRQQARIDELDTMVTELSVRKDQEMKRLQDENEAYQAEARQLEQEREQLQREQATMDETHKAIQSNAEKQRDQQIKQAKEEISDKWKARVKQTKEDNEKTIQTLKTDKNGLNDTIQSLEKNILQVQEDLKQQKETSDIDKRTFRSHIISLQSELDQINAASMVLPQTPEFYIDGFHRLWSGIQDVVDDEFRSLPEDTKLLESEAARERLSSASAIFQYPPLSSESLVATFLRACAVKNFLSTKMISIIERQYFAEPTAASERKAGTQPIDTILDVISSVPAATPSQDLSWRLMTVDKLDRLDSHIPSATTSMSTGPDQGAIVKEVWDHLHYLQSSSDAKIPDKLHEIAGMTIKLWSALRKDSCRVVFDYNPSTGDRQNWTFVEDVTMNSFKATNVPADIPAVQLPSKPFVLFPRITGFFDSDGSSPRILQAGSALSHDSQAFQEGIHEIHHIENVTKEFKRNLRRGSSAQSSPVLGKHQVNWPQPHHGFN